MDLLNSMTQKEFIKLLERYNSGTCTPVEKNLVEKWCDTILAGEKRTVEYSLEDRARMFEVIKASREKVFSVPHYRPKAAGAAIAAAAAVVLAVLCIALYSIHSQKSSEASLPALNLTQNPIFNNTSKPIVVSLPDGTEVSLYPKSKLSTVAFTKTKRNLRLEGKAFFKVTHDAEHPFLVFTDKLVTKVLGTSFTINAGKGVEESVEVKTGKVAVYRSAAVKGKNSYQLPDFYVTITPNQQVHFDTLRHRLVKSLVTHPALIQSPELKEIPSAWAANSLRSEMPMSFEGTPVTEIFKMLELSYGVEIKYNKDKISNCILTVTMDGADLFTRLQVVCNAINGKYRVDETKIVISSPGCE